MQGNMTFEIEQKKINLEAGEIMYIPPGNTFTRCASGGSWWIYIYLFDQKRWDPLKKRGIYKRQYEYAPLMYSLLRTILDAKANRSRNAILLARQNAQALTGLLKHEMAGVESPGLAHRYKLQQ